MILNLDIIFNNNWPIWYCDTINLKIITVFYFKIMFRLKSKLQATEMKYLRSEDQKRQQEILNQESH